MCLNKTLCAVGQNKRWAKYRQIYFAANLNAANVSKTTEYTADKIVLEVMRATLACNSVLNPSQTNLDDGFSLVEITDKLCDVFATSLFIHQKSDVLWKQFEK